MNCALDFEACVIKSITHFTPANVIVFKFRPRGFSFAVKFVPRGYSLFPRIWVLEVKYEIFHIY